MAVTRLLSGKISGFFSRKFVQLVLIIGSVFCATHLYLWLHSAEYLGAKIGSAREPLPLIETLLEQQQTMKSELKELRNILEEMQSNELLHDQMKRTMSKPSRGKDEPLAESAKAASTQTSPAKRSVRGGAAPVVDAKEVKVEMTSDEIEDLKFEEDLLRDWKDVSEEDSKKAQSVRRRRGLVDDFEERKKALKALAGKLAR